MSEEENLLLFKEDVLVGCPSWKEMRMGQSLTSFLACFSSGVSSGSLGVAAFSVLFSSDSLGSFAFLVLLLAALVSVEAFAALGVVDVPLVVFGVELVVSLILGFLTESERAGVCRQLVNINRN